MYLNKFLYCVFALYSAVGLCAESKLPNIIFVSTDNLGFGDVQCNNPESKIQTPNIDRIANGGWSFPKPASDDHSGLSPLQLYDLSVDSGETKNLFDSYPERVAL
jgi:hypothetical protein